MRRIVGAVLLLGMLFLLARCDFMAPEEEKQLVVEAFFQSGAPLGPITLRTTRPLDPPAGDTSVAPARGAELVLRMDGQRVSYHPVDSVPGRYVPETSMIVPARASFALSVRWQDQTATADGRVPPPITIEQMRVDVPDEPVQAILVDSLRRDSLDIPAEQGYIYPIEVTVAWRTDFPEVGPDSTYWIRTQLEPYTTFSSTVVDFFLQPEEVFRERTVRRGVGRRRWTGVYAVPVDSKDEPLPRHQMRVSLVRSGPEYAAFAASRNDPERREPLSNVQGAIGIATAIALDSMRVEVGGEGVQP